MINSVRVYMYGRIGSHPFAAICRGDKSKFYRLTKASAWRLGFACHHIRGRFSGDGQGWTWART